MFITKMEMSRKLACLLGLLWFSCCNAFAAPPVGVADQYSTDFETNLEVDVTSGVLSNDTDADVGDELSAALVSDVSDGTLVLNSDGSFTYTPDTGFSGTDSFDYVANDTTEDSSAVTVTLTFGGTVRGV